MEIQRVEDPTYASGAEIGRLANLGRRCIYYKEDICSAPKARFAICKTCSRICLKAAVSNVFDKILSLAGQLFNPPATPPAQSPPASSPPG